MRRICIRCGGWLITEQGEFEEVIHKCILCGRAPEEKIVTKKEVLAIMRGENNGSDEPRTS